MKNKNNNNSLEIDTVYHQNNQKSKISPSYLNLNSWSNG